MNNVIRVFLLSLHPTMLLKVWYFILLFNFNNFITAQWVSQTSGVNYHLYSVSFSDSLHGIVVGAHGTILSTTNGGNNWIVRNSGTNLTLNAISLSDNLHGATVGDSGIILITSDGGENWLRKTTGFVGEMLGVTAFDSLNLIVSGEPGVILKTTDAGDSWVQQFNAPGHIFNEICFTDKFNGIATGEWQAGTLGLILKTSDGGNVWDVIVSHTFPIIDVSFADSLTGYVLFYYDVLWGTFLEKTTDGGATWTFLSLGDTSYWAVYFTDTENGTAVGPPGSIKRTTNGGNEWLTQYSGTSNNLTKVCFTDPLNGTAVGYNGTIVSTKNGGGITSLDNDMPLPSTYQLMQNYPNPFNPETTIGFSIPEKTLVKLSVFDIIGRELLTLINEEKPAGSYTVRLNLLEHLHGNMLLSSGVYFYQLLTENETLTKKMILLK